MTGEVRNSVPLKPDFRWDPVAEVLFIDGIPCSGHAVKSILDRRPGTIIQVKGKDSTGLTHFREFFFDIGVKPDVPALTQEDLP